MPKTHDPIDSNELKQAPDNEIESLKEKIAQLEQANQALQEEVSTTHDKHMRLLADSKNRERLHVEKIKQTREYALSQFLEQLIHIVDALESGLAHIPKEESNTELKSLHQGLDMTHKMLMKLLEENAMVAVKSDACDFDPKLHEAINTTSVEDKPNNWIIETIQKGYTLKGRLIRPARVIINQLNENTEPS